MKYSFFFGFDGKFHFTREFLSLLPGKKKFDFHRFYSLEITMTGTRYWSISFKIRFWTTKKSLQQNKQKQHCNHINKPIVFMKWKKAAYEKWLGLKRLFCCSKKKTRAKHTDTCRFFAKLNFKRKKE